MTILLIGDRPVTDLAQEPRWVETQDFGDFVQFISAQHALGGSGFDAVIGDARYTGDPGDLRLRHTSYLTVLAQPFA